MRPIRLPVGLAFLLIGAAIAAQDLGMDAALRHLDAKLSWDSIARRGVLSRGEKTAAFVVGLDEVLISGTDKRILPSPRFEGAALVFPEEFLSAVKAAFDAPAERPRFAVAAILIDPGHGGKDPGALASHGSGKGKFTVVEKDVTLKVGTMVYERLRQGYPDKRLFITRSGDTYPSLADRVELANSVSLGKDEAVIYVSIHVNASINKNGRGFEVWYLDPSIRRKVLSEAQKENLDPDLVPILNDMMEEEITTESILLANGILSALDESLGSKTPKRGIVAADWYVVKHALMPSALVELPFATNPTDALLLNDPEYLKRMADAVYNGIVAFVNYFETSKGFTE
jgi:N-acetylmuramoyl-L-alanine amidase